MILLQRVNMLYYAAGEGCRVLGIAIYGRYIGFSRYLKLNSFVKKPK